MKVYLDYGATSFKKPKEVFNKIEEFYKFNNTNPGRGGYQLALEAGKLVFNTRMQIKELFNPPPPKLPIIKDTTFAL